MKDRAAKLAAEPPGLRQHLEAIRASLLDLHKTLVDSERIEYEKTIGKIQSPNHFLQLLTNDPWFAWLGPLSQLIVSMDESLEAKEPFTKPVVDALLRQAFALVSPSETGSGFSRHYFEALQRDPDVVMAHADFNKVRNPK